MITLDGSKGGGQLLRSALTLSAITGKPFVITNIRQERNKPGLQAQHLAAVEAVRDFCHARVAGNTLGSSQLSFFPEKPSKHSLSIDIGTAGSTTLVLQTLLPICLSYHRDVSISVKGGTDTAWCPPSLYFRDVFCDFLTKMGIKHSFEIVKYGFFPKGGGEVKLRVFPTPLRAFSFTERGHLQDVSVSFVASSSLSKKNVLGRMEKGFKEEMKKKCNSNALEADSLSEGCFTHAYAAYLQYRVGDDALGEKEKRAEEIGKECAEKLQTLLKKDGVDLYATDQLLIYLALAGEGKILASEITDHVKTNIEVIQKFLPVKFTITKNLITCETHA